MSMTIILLHEWNSQQHFILASEKSYTVRNSTVQTEHLIEVQMEIEDNSATKGSDSSSLPESMENILLLSKRSHESPRERLNMCCRPTYRIRKLKNKGAILILVHNFLVTGVFYYLSMYAHKFHPTRHMYSIVWGLTLPIAGWLADVYLGRYTK